MDWHSDNWKQKKFERSRVKLGELFFKPRHFFFSDNIPEWTDKARNSFENYLILRLSILNSYDINKVIFSLTSIQSSSQDIIIILGNIYLWKRKWWFSTTWILIISDMDSVFVHKCTTWAVSREQVIYFSQLLPG